MASETHRTQDQDRLEAATAAAHDAGLPDDGLAPLSRVEPFLGMATRGEPRSVTANTEARDAWIRARRARLSYEPAGTLRAALSSGWNAM